MLPGKFWTRPEYQQRFKVRGWNISPTPLHEPKLMHLVFPGMSKQDHERQARRAIDLAHLYDATWQGAVTQARKLYGEGDGVLIAGVYRDHFPAKVKDKLRSLAHTKSLLSAIAWAHWRAAGKRGHLPSASKALHPGDVTGMRGHV